jgi:hypothetical protein
MEIKMPRLSKEEKARRVAEIDAKIAQESRTPFGECDLCKVKFYSAGEDQIHYNSIQHKEKVRREAQFVSAESKGIDSDGPIVKKA